MRFFRLFLKARIRFLKLNISFPWPSQVRFTGLEILTIHAIISVLRIITTVALGISTKAVLMARYHYTRSRKKTQVAYSQSFFQFRMKCLRWLLKVAFLKANQSCVVLLPKIRTPQQTPSNKQQNGVNTHRLVACKVTASSAWLS